MLVLDVWAATSILCVSYHKPVNITACQHYSAFQSSGPHIQLVNKTINYIYHRGFTWGALIRVIHRPVHTGTRSWHPFPFCINTGWVWKVTSATFIDICSSVCKFFHEISQNCQIIKYRPVRYTLLPSFAEIYQWNTLFNSVKFRAKICTHCWNIKSRG